MRVPLKFILSNDFRFPDEKELSLVVFALANGPVLVAAAVYRNSLVYHHQDKITSCYIHLLPASLTFW